MFGSRLHAEPIPDFQAEMTPRWLTPRRIKMECIGMDSTSTQHARSPWFGPQPGQS